MRRIAVVGGGITGLAAAFEVTRNARDAHVVLFESGDRVGGKIRTSRVAGHPVDEGADAFLVRVPDAVELCNELELTDTLVAPAAREAFIYVDGVLRRLPGAQLMGVPTDLEALATSGILSPAGLDRARDDLTSTAPPLRGDASIGAVIRPRLGDEVYERLVGPLVGGINAGDADALSIRACAPQIAAAAERGGSLIAAARALRSEASVDPTAAIFNAPRDGMGAIVDRLAKVLGASVRTSSPVRRLQPEGTRWRLDADPEPFDGVVLATPAATTARLVDHAAIAASLGAIETVSVVMVTLALRRDRVAHPLDGSGFLVPERSGVPDGSGGIVTACSFASTKWAHLGDDDVAILRVSAGRERDTRAVEMSDQVLVETVTGELRSAIGLSGEPDEVRVTRWHDAFPQYRPGHLERVAEIDAHLTTELPGIEVACAALRGVGVPARIREGREAARRVTA